MIFVFFIFNPIFYWVTNEGLHEDFCGSFLMVVHSSRIMLIFLVYIFIALFYNISLVGVTFYTTAVFASISEIIGSSVSWLIDLFIYYVFDGSFMNLSNKKFGIAWDNMSYLRLIGSVVILIGALCYMKIITFPCLTYDKPNVTKINLQEANEEAIVP